MEFVCFRDNLPIAFLGQSPTASFLGCVAALEKIVNSSASFDIWPVCLSVTLIALPSFSDHLLTSSLDNYSLIFPNNLSQTELILCLSDFVL